MKKFLVGIDEAGRGPIAGPVAVAVFAVSQELHYRVMKFFPEKKVKDSKKLSPIAREEIYKLLQKAKVSGEIFYTVSFSGAGMIDRKGISFAIKQALARSLEKLNIKQSQTRVLLDGALRAPSHFTNQKTIIKGDEKEAVIALASIVAKVSRDRLMVRFAKKFPQYGFEIHKGYGTSGHYKAINKHGFSVIHRRSFLKNLSK